MLRNGPKEVETPFHAITIIDAEEVNWGMRRRSFCASAAGVALTVSLVLTASGVGAAHERRQVGAYVMRVGWADEPTYAGVKNAVQLLLSDASGKPFTEVLEDLKVEVMYGTQKMGPLTLDAAFGKNFGRPGDFRATVIPTRPGNYTFHFVGAVKGQKIDQSFTSSDTTFDPVREGAVIEFPAKDPSPGELAVKLDRLSGRLEGTAAQSAEARLLGGAALLGVIIGAVLLGAVRLRAGGRAG